MASIQETHAGVAGVTPHGQPRPLHRAADDDARTSRSKRATAVRPGSGPVRSITRGEAEGPATGPGSQGPEARKRQRNTEAEHEHPAHTNRVFVIGSDGQPLMPCTVQRARQLIDARRVKHRDYRPFTIHLKDRRRDDGQTPVQPTEVRCTPGARRTGIAVVIQLEHEDRVVYQEEVEHRTDIGRRLQERKGHRRRRRGTKWCRPPRFDNRRRGPEWVAPTIESIVSNQTHRLNRLAQRSGAGGAVAQTAKFDTQKILDPAIQGTEYQQGPLYQEHVELVATYVRAGTQPRNDGRENENQDRTAQDKPDEKTSRRTGTIRTGLPMRTMQGREQPLRDATDAGVPQGQPQRAGASHRGSEPPTDAPEQRCRLQTGRQEYGDKPHHHPRHPEGNSEEHQGTDLTKDPGRDRRREGRRRDYPGGESWKRLRWLIEKAGFTKSALARMLGSKEEVPRLQVRKDRVRVKTARKIKRLYDQYNWPSHRDGTKQ